MVFPNRLRVLVRGAVAVAAELVQSFALVPAVVFTLLDDVDLFPNVLADVGRPERAGLFVERHSPNVAEAQSPNLAASAGRIDERIVLRHGVRQAGILMV